MDREAIKKISSEIDKIGEDLVKCNNNCEGVCGGNEEDKKKGIMPRCLYFEERHGEGGIIVVGMNPGVADEKYEKNEFLDKEKRNYPCYKSFFEKKMLRVDGKNYYNPVRKVVDKLGFNGSILWTEIVKCQCAEKKKNLTKETKIICANNFLKKEVKTTPSDWQIITIGNPAYDLCSKLFSKRKIIGIYHNSGQARRYWKKFLKKFNETTKDEIREYLKLKLNNSKAFHLRMLEGI